MTHDRGGAALIGGVALAVLAVDLTYVASRWRGFSTSLDRGFLLGVGFLLVLAVAGLLLRGRRKSWLNTRVQGNLIFIAVLGAVIAAANSIGRDASTGLMVGVLAALCAFFAVFSGWWIVRSQHSAEA